MPTFSVLSNLLRLCAGACAGLGAIMSLVEVLFVEDETAGGDQNDHENGNAEGVVYDAACEERYATEGKCSEAAHDEKKDVSCWWLHLGGCCGHFPVPCKRRVD